MLAGFFAAVQEARAAELLLAYHDRCDGGLFVTLLEMAFASGTGLECELADLPGIDESPLAALFNEELGAVVQVRAGRRRARRRDLRRATGWPDSIYAVGRPHPGDRVVLRRGGDAIFDEPRTALRGDLVGDHARDAGAARRPDLRRRGAGGARRSRGARA